MGKFRTTDRAAAEELFSACYPRLAGWVRRLVDDDDTAHEIAAEAFTRLLARWSSLDNPQSYLYMIATNLVRDHWRRAGRERRALRAVSAASHGDPVHHPSQDVDVRALIQSLPAYVGMTTATQGVAVPADPAQHAIWFTYDGGSTWQPSPVAA